MKVDYENMELTIHGKVHNIDTFKWWYLRHYQVTLPAYRIKGDTIDWHSILLDVQKSGIIEIFENEINLKDGN